MSKHTLRPVRPSDAAAMLRILEAAAAEGDSLPFERVDAALIDQQWLKAPNCWLAETCGRIEGMYRMGPNMPGRGGHVASATYIVAAAARGQGLGRRLVEHSLELARGQGYAGMQFNFVAATNTAALRLYESLEFRVVGSLPGAFRHASLGLVDALVLFRSL
ncbi:GNAT family N-acetyltransferase [Massilia endophytica]|uniref:GNAT family N-acetyltransferase n=1 Tax=Massilia endophytica TaxID=2899220 RepID=UPI001E388E74|nr:N-acetyltransferase [Massilia endophytica]UGQ48155.1 GNAT family N-acetyltransferase [Massilia endophytica]